MSDNRLIRPLAMACGLIPLVLVAACASTPPPVTGRTNPQASADLGQVELVGMADGSYILRANDVISLVVFREPDLSAAGLQVGSDGTVSVPLLGNIAAAGKSPAQFAEEIRAGLSPRYILHPSVSVNVVEYGSHTVSVEGAVTSTGLYAFKPGIHLSGAIALAGGLNRTAKMRQVVIFRPDDKGMMIAQFDYAAISQGTMMDPKIMPGDRVIVGTSGMAQAYQDFLATAPILGVFARFVAY